MNCGCLPYAKVYCDTHQNWIQQTVEHAIRNGRNDRLPSFDLHRDCMTLVQNKGHGKMRIFCTDRILYDHLDKITTDRLARTEAEFRQTLMVSRIKRCFKRSISDPSYKMCRDRLQREYLELS